MVGIKCVFWLLVISVLEAIDLRKDPVDIDGNSFDIKLCFLVLSLYYSACYRHLE